MAASGQARVAEALRQLEEYGLLLLQDPRLPCVTTIVAGGPIRGSWLGHPLAHGTYEVLVALEDHPEVLHTKLVSGKVTIVHRRLWPALVSMALARSVWQLEGLSLAAKWLLEEVDARSSVQTDQLQRQPPPALGVNSRQVPEAARELERRLLVHATEVHTPSGRHAKVLQTWQCWLSSVQPPLVIPREPAAREQLEAVVARLDKEFNAAAKLPWPQRPQPAPR